MNNSENEAGVEAKLDIVIKLLAAMYTKGSNKTDAIIKLADLSLSNSQIAEIVAVSGHHVSQVRYKNKGGGGKKNKSSDAEVGDAE